MIGAVIVAAGKSTRFGTDKLMLPYGVLTVIEASAMAFINHSEIQEIIIAVNADSEEAYRKIFEKYQAIKNIKFVVGGITRTESVKAALEVFDGDYVLIHDGARPNVSTALIGRVIEKTRQTGACVPVVPLKESIRNEDGAMPREWFVTAQTPQGFDFQKLKYAYNRIDGAYSDDASVYEAAFGVASTVEGDVENLKITYSSDYYGLVGCDGAVGVGYDAHRLEKGRKLIIGGVNIPFEKGLLGHSDADVLIHAIMDAMLSAISAGDIGKYFSDKDPAYKDISSLILLKNVNEIVIEKGYAVSNIAATVIAEAPRLAPFIPQMCVSIADSLNIASEKVGIAATTSEGLGIVGKGEGIAAYSIIYLKKIANCNNN